MITSAVRQEERYWRKGRHSKYRHLYVDKSACCGSKVSPLPAWTDSNYTSRAPQCPKCLRIAKQ